MHDCASRANKGQHIVTRPVTPKAQWKATAHYSHTTCEGQTQVRSFHVPPTLRFSCTTCALTGTCHVTLHTVQSTHNPVPAPVAGSLTAVRAISATTSITPPAHLPLHTCIQGPVRAAAMRVLVRHHALYSCLSLSSSCLTTSCCPAPPPPHPTRPSPSSAGAGAAAPPPSHPPAAPPPPTPAARLPPRPPTP